MNLEQNEIMIQDLDISQIACGTIEEDVEEDLSGAIIGTSEKGIFGGGEGGGGYPITWQNKFFNQLLIDPTSCFYMANWTALANTYCLDIPQSLIVEGWKDLVANSGHIPGVGGKASVGVYYALKHFNRHFGYAVRSITVPFNMQNIVTALKSGSNFVFGVKYGSGFFKNEQDDGIIQDTNLTTGNLGHLVCGIKANTMDDNLFKYAEQYHGVLGKEIILLMPDEYPELFQNTMTYFSK